MEASVKVQQLPLKAKSWQPTPKIYSELITITPQVAQRMLINGNGGNRLLSKYRVNILVEAIKRGEWVSNSNSIGFDVNGNLTDGQHRLNAVVLANRSIQSLVTYNLPPDSFKTTDIGKNRSSGDIAAIIGMGRNARTVGSAANLLFQFEHGYLGHAYPKRPTNTQIYALLNSHRGLEASAAVGQAVYPILPASIGAFCHYIFSQIDPGQADKFMDALKTGANLPLGHPCLTLRNMMVEARAEKISLQYDKVTALTILAWNAFRQDRRVKRLHYQPATDFPKPV